MHICKCINVCVCMCICVYIYNVKTENSNPHRPLIKSTKLLLLNSKKSNHDHVYLVCLLVSSVHMCIHTYMYVCMYIYTCVHVCRWINVCVHVCICVYTHNVKP